MEYFVTGDEMKRCDQTTIREFQMPSMVLMERAALACVETLKESGFDLSRVLVVCGSGNKKLWVITAYFPSTDKWESDFKTRKAAE